jgi:hypothetical protein
LANPAIVLFPYNFGGNPDHPMVVINRDYTRYRDFIGVPSGRFLLNVPFSGYLVTR